MDLSPEVIEENRVKALEIEIEILEGMIRKPALSEILTLEFEQHLREKIENIKQRISNPDSGAGFKGRYVKMIDDDLGHDRLSMAPIIDYPDFWSNPLIESMVEQVESAIPQEERREEHLEALKEDCEKRGKNWKDYQHLITGNLYDIPEGYPDTLFAMVDQKD